MLIKSQLLLLSQMISSNSNVLGLDIGTKRTGVARVNLSVRLPEALGLIDMTGDINLQLQEFIDEHSIAALVVGMPLNMNSRETDQSNYTRGVINDLKKHFRDLEFYMIDEVGTSKIADERAVPGVSRDAMAAAAILEDFIAIFERGEHKSVSI